MQIPDGFKNVLVYLKTEYNDPEIFVTENGFPDQGGLEDQDRLNYYQVRVTK